MKRFACAILSIILSLTFSVTAFASAVPRKVINAKKGVVRVFASDSANIYSGTGTGFVISNSSDGCIIITNYHVVENMDKFEMYFDGKGPVKLTVLATSEAQDLCALKTDTKVNGLKTLKLENKTVQSGDGVYALGYPGDADRIAQEKLVTLEQMTLTNGIVSAIQSAAVVGDGSKKVRIIQSNADINSGNSGGPMLNERGNVIGVNTFGMTNSLGVFGAVHIDELKLFIKYNVPMQNEPSLLLLIILILSAALIAAILAIIVLVINRKRKSKQLSTPMPIENAISPETQAEPAGEIESVQLPEAKPRRKKPIKLIIAISVLLLTAAIGGVVTFDLIGKQKAIEALDDAIMFGNYDLALNMFVEKPWLSEKTDAKLRDYCEAMYLVQNLKINLAQEKFKELGYYKDSQKQYENAKKYNVAKHATIIEAFKLFVELEDFADSRQQAQAKLEQAMNEGVEAMKTGLFGKALALFKLVPAGEFEDLDLLVEICNISINAQNLQRDENFKSEVKEIYLLSAVIDELGLSDISNYIMDEHIQAYLHGEWANSDGNYYSYDYFQGYYNGNLGMAGSMYFINAVGAHNFNGSDRAYFKYVSANNFIMYYNNNQYDFYRVA